VPLGLALILGGNSTFKVCNIRYVNTHTNIYTKKVLIVNQPVAEWRL